MQSLQAGRLGPVRPAAPERTALIAAVVVIAVVQLLARHMPAAGDEPEYIYYAYSLLRHHDLSMPLAQFGRAFPDFATIPPVAFRQYGHPVLVPLLASPLVGLLGTAGGRLFNEVVGLFGFVAVARMLAPIAGPTRSVLVALFVFTTFPVLAYLQVFYMEAAMMAVAAWSWLLGYSQRLRGLFLSASLAALLPFVHVRAAPIAAVLFALAVLGVPRIVRTPAGRVRGLAGMIGIAAVAGLVFLWHQHVLYGALVGGATATFRPSLTGYMPRLAVQLLSFRHGLLAVNPAMLTALAGLAVGLVRRSRPAIEAGLILVVYSMVFVWGTASESYPARFWVPVMPALAVGLATWMMAARSRAALAAGAVLAVLTLLNVAMFLTHQGAFLSNRTASITYDNMFRWFRVVDLASLFPWDSFDYAPRRVEPHLELDRLLLVSSGAASLLIVACFAIEATARRARRWMALLPAWALLVPLHGAVMRRLPSHAVLVVRTTDDRTHQDSILLTFCRPFDVRLLRYLGRPRELMGPPLYPAEFNIEAARDGGPLETLRAVPTSPVIAIPPGRYSAIRIWAPVGPGGPGWIAAPIEVLTAGLLQQGCFRMPGAAPHGAVTAGAKAGLPRAGP